MTHYSTASVTRLETAHSELRALFREVDLFWPHGILEGRRTVEQQRANVEKGYSKTMASKHLVEHSTDPASGVDAIDAAPDPLSWPKLHQRAAAIDKVVADLAAGGLSGAERERLIKLVQLELSAYAVAVGRYYYFGGYVLGTADQMRKHGELTSQIRYGGDWNMNRQIDDQSFNDLVHFERRPA